MNHRLWSIIEDDTPDKDAVSLLFCLRCQTMLGESVVGQEFTTDLLPFGPCPICGASNSFNILKSTETRIASRKSKLTTVEERANKGEPNAQFRLGVICELVQDDFIQAFKWFEKAAYQGHADAQYNVGASYANGDGVACDNEKAIFWLRKAKENGARDAEEQLNRLLSRRPHWLLRIADLFRRR